ncbi:hypothetical protein [Aegicerativicinus sediminis]|uniref:hypothetical protein n=1 Tax=Aegicerativicinus sediminis TaxID=2893202 RepID=UPI001E39447A|nr:hypothetical protein [Aegicerativicinus sediminis]
MIGILLALQVNNWNELRKTKEKEKVILKEIISDLIVNENNAQIRLMHTYDIGRDSIMKIFTHVINHLENKLPYDSILSRHFALIHQLPGLNIKTSGYESLKSSGLDMIQNDSLRSNIGEYYTVTIESTKGIYTELRDDFYNYILKFPRTIFVTKMDKNQRRIQIPTNYAQLLENVEYVESLKMFSGIYLINLNETKEYLSKTKILREKMEEYIDHN